MLRLDHLVIIAPSLEAGAAYVRATLGVAMSAGGRHPEMGTHNRVLRLGGDTFLEVIAVDPDAGKPDRRRWFGLDDAHKVAAEWDEGRRLRAWVARTDDLNEILAAHDDRFADKMRVSRGDRSWLFAEPRDAARVEAGSLPSLIAWGDRGPAGAMPDLGFRLSDFAIEHPEPAAVEAAYRALGLVDPPLTRSGPVVRYRAAIATPEGVKHFA